MLHRIKIGRRGCFTAGRALCSSCELNLSDHTCSRAVCSNYNLLSTDLWKCRTGIELSVVFSPHRCPTSLKMLIDFLIIFVWVCCGEALSVFCSSPSPRSVPAMLKALCGLKKDGAISALILIKRHLTLCSGLGVRFQSSRLLEV